MTITAITSYEVSLFLHITAVVVGFGATFAFALAFPLAVRLDPRHLPFVHRLSRDVSKYLVNPALVVVLATGLYQVSEADLSLGDFWLSAAFAILIAIGALNGAYFMPTDRRLGEMAQREIDASPAGEVQLSEDYQRRARTEGLMGALTGVLVIVVVYLMVDKPGL